MSGFQFLSFPDNLLTPSIVRKLTLIHEYKGQESAYARTNPSELETLVKTARIRSTEASNRIEGIRTSSSRLNQIMVGHAEPQNRDEAEIAGYRDVLEIIHESHEYVGVTPNVILQLHSRLYRHSAHAFAGKWKDSDSAIIETTSTGEERIRFKPLAAVSVSEAMDVLCDSFSHDLVSEEYDPVLLALKFTFDFTCIHPFIDGNGRMSRLLTLLLLYRSGFQVGRYVSIEAEIARTKETYYEALAASSIGWFEGESDYTPFVDYLLGVIIAVYQDFAQLMQGLTSKEISKPDRVAAMIDRSTGKFNKADIAEELPDISLTTIERTLSDLLSKGRIRKVGGGRSTGYVKD